MSFTTPEFALFVFLVLACFVLFKPGQRWIILLAASLVFYAALNAPYLLVALAAVTLISYFIGRRLPGAPADRQKWLLAGGVAGNLVVLFGMRYLPEIAGLFAGQAGSGGTPASAGPLLVSIGVSFFTFQAIAYLADLYLGTIEPETHLGRFALYMAFFPKILQGPIERGGSLLPQLGGEILFDGRSASEGLRRIAWGLFKKVIIADRLGLLVNPVFANVHQYTGLALILAVYLYAFQLYFDFSGYTDMALGLARLFNIRLSENFNRPYLARSISDFWRRWHMSFSRWILDYLFKPLQITLRSWGKWGVVAALLLAFLASGIWHGASLGFLAWGGLFGIYMAVEFLYTPWRKKIYRWLRIEKSWLAGVWQVFLTFNLVSFAWIFFRANTFSDGLYMAANLFNGIPLASCARLLGKYGVYLPLSRGTFDFSHIVAAAPQACFANLQNFPTLQGAFSSENVTVLLVSLLLLVAAGWVSKWKPVAAWPVGLRWLSYLAFSLWVLYGTAILEVPGQIYTQFLYFRF